MKNAAPGLTFLVLVAPAFAQGTVNFANTATTRIRTNAIGVGGTAGNTSPIPEGFYYTVLTASSSISSVSPSAQELLTPAWTFTGLYATNTLGGTGGLLGGGPFAATASGWPTGVTNSFVVVGWSSNLGRDWPSLAGELSGADLSGGVWTNGSWVDAGFFGVSPVGYLAAGGGMIPPPTLFAASPSGQGLPITIGFDLYKTTPPVPEPNVFALAGLAAAALVIFHRRRRRHASFATNTASHVCDDSRFHAKVGFVRPFTRGVAPRLYKTGLWPAVMSQEWWFNAKAQRRKGSRRCRSQTSRDAFHRVSLSALLRTRWNAALLCLGRRPAEFHPQSSILNHRPLPGFAPLR